MSTRLRKEKRLGGEFEDYPTPAWCVDRLLDDVYLPSGRWLEPCAGDGAIIKAVNARIPDVMWTAVDIRPPEVSTLERTIRIEALGHFEPGREGRTYVGCDFFDVADSLRTLDGRRWPFDVVFTNPPYTLASKFVEVCRTLAPIVVMLLRENYFESAKRNAILRQVMPEQNHVLPDRPSFRGGSSDSCAYGWMIWTPSSGPECRTRVLGLTPKEIRRPPRAKRKKIAASSQAEATA